jgi:hypothetical protein
MQAAMVKRVATLLRVAVMGCGSLAVQADASPAVGAVTGRVTLAHIPGSTRKINQLLGETDKERHEPTLSLTESRYRLRGTDLGYSFEHLGRLYFLFGDTVGAQGGALDSVATADEGNHARNPETGVRLNFLTESPGRYLTVQPPGIRMGAFEVPTAGISLGGQMYVIVDTDHAEDWSTDRAVLTRARWPLTPTGFEPLRTISHRPDGKFIKMSLRSLRAGRSC